MIYWTGIRVHVAMYTTRLLTRHKAKLLTLQIQARIENEEFACRSNGLITKSTVPHWSVSHPPYHHGRTVGQWALTITTSWKGPEAVRHVYWPATGDWCRRGLDWRQIVCSLRMLWTRIVACLLCIWNEPVLGHWRKLKQGNSVTRYGTVLSLGIYSNYFTQYALG